MLLLEVSQDGIDTRTTCLTRLKNESPANENITAVARWDDALVGAHERADYECRGFTDGIEGSEF